jgi:hypothetical protein
LFAELGPIRENATRRNLIMLVKARKGFKTLLAVAMALGVAVAGAGCRRPPPPPAPPPPAPAPMPVAAPPPAPVPEKPKCLSLAENCVAAADTQLDVGTKGAWFKPPLGWTYAKEENLSFAAASDGFAAVAMGPAAGVKPEEVAPALEPLLARLEASKVNLKSIKRWLKQPDSVTQADGAEIRLWEVDKRRQDGKSPEMKSKPGALLVIVATFAEQPIVGAAFVVKPEGEAQAGAVMEAVQSLRPKR